MVLRENIPLSLTSYQKCLMQPAIAKQATIETKYDVALFVKQAGLFGGDGGLKKRDFSQQTSCLWRVSLKDFSLFWGFFFIPHCQRLPLPARSGGGGRREVNAVLMPRFWSGDQLSNRIPKVHHSPVTAGMFTERRGKSKFISLKYWRKYAYCCLRNATELAGLRYELLPESC